MLGLMRRRSFAYEALVRIFAIPPDEAIVQGILSMSGDFVESGNNTMEDIEADASRLFCNMALKSVSPYESVYISNTHLLMQQPRDEVLAEYRFEGWEPSGELRIPEDHIVFELEFMARLAEEAAAAIEEGQTDSVKRLIESQSRFLEKHICKWVPNFCSDASAAAETSFYRDACDILRRFIDEDAGMLKGKIAGCFSSE